MMVLVFGSRGIWGGFRIRVSWFQAQKLHSFDIFSCIEFVFRGFSLLLILQKWWLDFVALLSLSLVWCFKILQENLTCDMMGIGKLGLCFCIFVIISALRAFGAFTPEDNYLIDCGSVENTTIGTRTFVADTSVSSTITAPGSILANTSSNSVSSFDSSALYRTARIFTGSSSYSFSIQKHGRHFIRLYFFPFVFQSYNLSAANFTVSTDDVVLLHNFRPQGSSSPVFREYSVNINRDKLILSFAPSGSPALAFINAIKVVSVPDYLINDTVMPQP